MHGRWPNDAGHARTRTVSYVLVGVLALVAYVWTLPLPFQYDDYWLLPYAPLQLQLLGQVLADLPGLFAWPPNQLPLDVKHLFQPLCWLLNVTEAELGGVPFAPALYHSVTLLLHVGTSLAVLRLLRHELPASAALAGAAFFTLHPAGAQAVSWTAARGDLLVTLFAVLAFTAARRAGEHGAVRAGLVPGLLLACGLLCKPTATVFVPVVLIALWWTRRPRGTRSQLLGTAALLVPFALVYLIRSRYLSSWAVTYAGGMSPSVTNFGGALEALPRFVRYLALPWNPAPEVHALAPIAARWAPGIETAQTWLLPLFAVPPLLAVLASWRRTLPRLLASALLLGALAYPTLLFWHLLAQFPANNIARTLYPLMPVLAFAFGTCALPLFEVRLRSSSTRLALGAALVAVLLLGLDSLVHVARTELAAGRAIAARIEGTAAHARRAGPDVSLLVHDAQALFAGIPQTFTELPEALAPPFHATKLDVHYAFDRETLRRSGFLHRHRAAILPLVWNGERILPLGPQLPPLPEALPALAPSPASTPQVHVLRPEAPVPPRAFVAVRIRFAPGPETTARILLVGTTGTKVERTARLGPAAQDVVISFEEETDWLYDPGLDVCRVEIAPEAAEGRTWTSAELLGRVPELPLVTPAPGAELPLGPVPRFCVGAVPDAALLRFTFAIGVFGARFDVVYEARPGTWERSAEGGACYVPRPEDLTNAAHALLAWPSLPVVYRDHVVPIGADSLTVHWRVEVLHAEDRSVLARSAERQLTLVPE